MEFYIGTPVDESFRRERPEEFFIGTPVPGGPGTPPQTGKRDSDEISGVAVASVLERTTSDGEISGVAGRAELGRTWDGRVLHPASCQDGWGDNDEVSGVVEKPVVERPPLNDEISGITERSVPKRPARPDGEIPGVTGKSVNSNSERGPGRRATGERSVHRMRVDNDGRDEAKAPLKWGPLEFFMGTPTPGTLRTPSIWQGASETLMCDSLHGVRDSGCEMQLSSMSTEVGPVSSVFEVLYRFVGIDPDSITTEQFLVPYACGGQSNYPQSFPRTLGDCLEGRPLLGHGMRDLDGDSGEVQMGMRCQTDAYVGECILHVQDVPNLRRISQFPHQATPPQHVVCPRCVGAWWPWQLVS